MARVPSEWHWRADGPSGGRSRGATRVAGPLVGPDRFPTQGEAETWLGETYPDLLDAGVRAVSLYEADRLVYGPMSLEAEPA